MAEKPKAKQYRVLREIAFPSRAGGETVLAVGTLVSESQLPAVVLGEVASGALEEV